MGMFDDLVPQSASPPARGGMFDDLIPTEQPQAAPQLSELDQRMNERVASEAAKGLAPQPSPAQYLPFGSWLDEAAAGLDAGLGKVTGGRFGAPSYEEAKAYQDARQRYIDENAGGMRKGAAMVGGMVASAPFGAAKVFKGSTILPQMGNAAVTGAGYGALYGSGEGEGSQRLENAAGGAAMGASLGAAVAPVARGVGNAFNYMQNRRAPTSGPLAGMERRAISSTIDDMQSSGIDPATYAQKSRELGPNGMLLDMGEDATLTANALANTNGPQMPIVRRAMQERQADAPQRVKDLANSTLGTPRDIPAYLEAQSKAYQQAAKPYYDQFYAASVKPTPDLAKHLYRAEAAGAYQRAAKIMAEEGIDPNLPQNSGRFLDLIKQSLDELSDVAKTQNDKGALRRYSMISRDLRNEVDRILSPQDPAQSPWAVARSIWQPGAQEREALDVGRKVFSGKMRPYDLRDELQGASQSARRGIKIGARDDLNTIMGRAATNFGPKGDAPARRALNSEFSRENLSLIAGPQKAVRLAEGINAENRMAESFNEIMANSATAKRTAAQRRLPMSSEKPLGDNQPRSIGEAAFVAARKVLNAVMAGGLNERANRIMSDQARILTARGVERDQYVQALLQLGQQRGMTAKHRDTIVRMINAIGGGARAPLIESATSQRSNP